MYIVLALIGVWVARRSPATALLVTFIVVRTAYFAAFADEAPEPRYVLECFPAVIALGAQTFGGKFSSPPTAQDESSGGRFEESAP